MEQSLKSLAVTPSSFLLALRQWPRSFRANLQHSRDMKCLSQLSDHILRDIGCEDFITYPVNASEHRR